MLDKVKELIGDVKAFNATTKEDVEAFRIKYLGSKGLLKDLFSEFKNVDAELRKDFGQALNNLKKSAEGKVEELNNALENAVEEKGIYGDLTRPSEPIELGSRHPISLVKNQIIEVFNRIGFTVSEGPEIEDDWHNFTALNLPEYHPARDMQDTFFIEKNPDTLLRTHTSSVQVRYMEENQPPIRTISPGRVFRNEDISARAHCIFHQVEGLYIDTDVSFVVEELKNVWDPKGGEFIPGKKYVPSFIALLGSIIEEHLKSINYNNENIPVKGNVINISLSEKTISAVPDPCPSCNSFNIIKQSGCETCKDCGHSKCG